MSLSGSLKVEYPDGREPQTLRFEVAEADADILRRFSMAAHAMLSAVNRAGGLPARVHLSFEPGRGVQFNTEEPTEDQRAAILHFCRPILLTNEPGSFDRACGAVRRSSDHTFLSEHLRRLRHIFSGGDIRDTVVISRGDIAINSDVAFQHWLNGFEYHNDDTRAAMVSQPGDLVPYEAVRPLFMMMLVEKVKAIALLAYLVDRILELPASTVQAPDEPEEPLPE